MAKVALDGCDIKTSTARNHIRTQVYRQTGTTEGEDPSPIMGWVSSSTDARINGTVVGGSNDVYINGRKAVRQNDRTTERDSYSLASNERYVSGAHSNAQGTVTRGNSRNVYVNGQPLVVENATVNTHANTTTTLGSSRLSNNVFVG